jgi:hypothetical protein
MTPHNSGDRTAALQALANDVFAKTQVEHFKTGIGIVATNWKDEIPRAHCGVVVRYNLYATAPRCGKIFARCRQRSAEFERAVQIGVDGKFSETFPLRENDVLLLALTRE